MSKRTEELFKLHRQIEELQEREKQLKESILNEEILGKGKDCLQDRFVTVSHNRGTEASVSVDSKALQQQDTQLYNVLVVKYPKYSAGRAPYYVWTFAKDK